MSLFESDLYLLKYIFFEKAAGAIVFDPDGQVKENFDSNFVYVSDLEDLADMDKHLPEFVLINMDSKNRIRNELLTTFKGVISGSRYSEKARNGLSEHAGFYLENSFGSFRFVYTQHLSDPLFTKVLHKDVGYTRLYKLGADIGFNTGRKGGAADGKFWVYRPADEPMTDTDGEYSSFFVFAEDYLFTHRFIKYIEKDHRIWRLVKDAVSGLSEKETLTEAFTLKTLNENRDFELLQIPGIEIKNDKLYLDYIYPDKVEKAFDIHPLMIQGLAELYKDNVKHVSLTEFLEETQALGSIRGLKSIMDEGLHPRGMSKQHSEEICIEILSLINKLDKNTLIPVSLYHGSFTTWNMTYDSNHLYLTDWSKARADMPLLFDLFHFIFNKLEYTEKPDMSDMDEMLTQALRLPPLVALVKEHELHFKLHWALFHVFYILERLEKMIKQRYVDVNFNWTLFFWKHALNRLNEISI